MTQVNDMAPAPGGANGAAGVERQALATLLLRQTEVLRALEVDGWEKPLRAAHERVLANEARVLVLGEPSRGKSTLINALLGREVLLASVTFSSVVNVVAWGDAPSALVRPAGAIPQAAREVAIEEVASASRNGGAGGGTLGELTTVELQWPLDLCRRGVRLVELPTLAESHPSFIHEQLADADAVVFVLACDALGSRTELGFIDDHLAAAGVTDPFFVCNRLDSVRPAQREALMAHALATLAPRTIGGSEHVFFMSALDALDGAYEGDTERTDAAAGLEAFRATLTAYLEQPRALAKVKRAAALLRASIRLARQTLAGREDAAEATLAAAPALASPPRPSAMHDADALRRWKEARSRVLGAVAEESKLTEELARTTALNTLLEASDRVPVWTAEPSVGMFGRLSASLYPGSSGKVAQEMADHVLGRVEAELEMWRRGALAELVAQRVKALGERLRAEMEPLFSGGLLNAAELGAAMIASPSGGAGAEYPPPLVSSTFRGAMPPLYASTLVTVPATVALLGAATVRMVGWKPLVQLPLFTAGALLAAYLSANATYEMIRRRVEQWCTAELRRSADAFAEREAERVSARLYQIRAELDARFDQALQRAADRAVPPEAAGADASEGTATPALVLAGISAELDTINRELGKIVEAARVQRAP